MRFAKYHGIGNDFVLIADPQDELKLSPEFVRRVCDRRFGVGGDGVIRVAPSEDADFFMDYVNSDGSIGEMCGNGIRCLAVFARAEGLTDKTKLRVSTRAGLRTLEVLGDGRVRADMGPPVFHPAAIPVKWDGDDALKAAFEVENDTVQAACVGMGNPHAVLYVENVEAPRLMTLGPILETHDAFPNGTNVEYAHVESPDRIRMRVWERGSGETLACGTGACAVGVVSRVLKDTYETVTIALPGGELEVSWSGWLDREAPVYLTGPVAKSFEGELEARAYA